MLVYHFTDLVKCLLIYMSVGSQYCTVLIIIIALSYNLKSESMMPPVLIFLKIALPPWGLWWVHMNFWDCFPIPVKIEILMEIALTLRITLGSMVILKILVLLMQEHGIFPLTGVFFNYLYQCFIIISGQIFHLCLKLFLSILFFLMVL